MVSIKTHKLLRRLNLGILRLKKDKDTNARRILLRNSTNGKILIVCFFLKIMAPKKDYFFVD